MLELLRILPNGCSTGAPRDDPFAGPALALTAHSLAQVPVPADPLKYLPAWSRPASALRPGAALESGAADAGAAPIMNIARVQAAGSEKVLRKASGPVGSMFVDIP